MYEWSWVIFVKKSKFHGAGGPDTEVSPKTSAVGQSGEATKDEDIPKEDYNEEEEPIEEQKSKENPHKKTWKKILKMKIIQLMQKRMKGSDFLSNQKNPPEKSAAGPNVMRSSSSIKPDLTKEDPLPLRVHSSPSSSQQRHCGIPW